MPAYEYKVVPAPRKGQKFKGVKGTEDRYAKTVETVMNDFAADGWEYLRADVLPSEERSGLTGRTTIYQTLLVFRRAIAAEAPAEQQATAPALAAPAPEAAVKPARIRPMRASKSAEAKAAPRLTAAAAPQPEAAQPPAPQPLELVAAAPEAVDVAKDQPVPVEPEDASEENLFAEVTSDAAEEETSAEAPSPEDQENDFENDVRDLRRRIASLSDDDNAKA